MIATAELTKIIGEILVEHGFKLYELQYNPSKSKNLQVFIIPLDNSEEEAKTIIVGDCAKLSRKILNTPELEMFFEEFGLEVSSPGLERKLKSEEHFIGAIGEEIKMVFKFGEKAGDVIIGKLASFVDGVGKLEAKDQQGIEFKYIDVKSAQVVVDFKSLLSASKP